MPGMCAACVCHTLVRHSFVCPRTHTHYVSLLARSHVQMVVNKQHQWRAQRGGGERRCTVQPLDVW